jgi:hypothetical protein
MSQVISTKFLAAAGLAIVTVVAASTAHARSDVFLSIGLGPGAYVQPAPVYVQPRPVYVQPAPVYVQPQPYYAPAPVYYSQGYSQGWEHRRGHQNYRHNNWRAGPNGDLDRDGIRNQYDRDIDGDGVRNRRDRAPANPRYR